MPMSSTMTQHHFPTPQTHKNSKELYTDKQAVSKVLAVARSLSHRVPRGAILSPRGRTGLHPAISYTLSFHTASVATAGVSGLFQVVLFPEEATFGQTVKANPFAENKSLPV